MNHLQVFAGRKARQHILENGLCADDITAVFGASGAAKWLTIYGLDSAVFCHWFKNRTAPLYLFGTSIGAWKFAAAARPDPEIGFELLKEAYIHQYYNGKITDAKIASETERIMNRFLNGTVVDEILSHPFLRMAFSAVRCKGLMASRVKLFQASAMWSAFELNLLSRKLQTFYFDRVVFHDTRYDIRMFELDDFPTHTVALTRNNFTRALLATASIPLIMEGVRHIDGAPKGTYRDGGLLDYHPVFPLPEEDPSKGFILYPHFYPFIKQGWFDKKLPGRNASGSILDRVILLSPSPEFVDSLPFRRIPDRQDFIRLKGKDEERVSAWEEAAQMSGRLGDEFLSLVENGTIKEQVLPLP